MLISIPIIAAILLFAFVNNELVTFTLWSELEVTSSFSVVVIAFILLGFILGRVSAWIAYLPLRKNLITLKMQNKKLGKEHQKVCEEVTGLKGDLDSLKNRDSGFESSSTEEKSGIKASLIKIFKSPEK
jgi:hypothetical protein